MAQFARDESVVVNGLRLRYRDWGGSGQAVVLLHGLASTSHIWDLVAPILANDFAVTALDQRGHGRSDKPDHGYDFTTMTSDLHGFIDGLKLERPLIVGHSWGGSVALEYGVRHPGVPRGLCFVDGGMIEISGRPGATLEQAKIDMAPPVFDGVTAAQLRERARSRRWLGSMTEQFEETLLANFDVLEGGFVRARLSRDNHMRIIEALWEHKPSTLYASVECPVLIMPARRKGDDSPAARRFGREESVRAASAKLPVSEIVWLEDSIHDVPLQRPQLVAEVIAEHVRSGFFGEPVSI